MIRSSKSALYFVVLLAVIQLSNSAYSSSVRITDRCPAWMESYEKFHRQHKNNPDDTTKYFIWRCSASFGHCRGFGDRLRGMLLALRIAVTFNRVLLFNWDEPFELEVVMHPNRINWSMLDMDNREQLLNTKNEYSTDIWLTHNTKFADAVLKGVGLAQFNATKVVVARFLDLPYTSLWGQVRGDVPAATTPKAGLMDPPLVRYLGCLAKFMFKPSEELERMTQDAQRTLFNTNMPPKYVACKHFSVTNILCGGPSPTSEEVLQVKHWPTITAGAGHWRTGGQEGETYQVTKDARLRSTSRLHMLLAGLVCLETMKEKAGVLSGMRAVLATDLNPVRTMVVQGILAPGLTTLDITAVHPEKGTVKMSKDDTIAINMAAWTEIMVMSRAECLLASDSGFSLIALMMSDSHCFQQMYDCTREASNTLGSVPLHHRKLLNVN